VAEEAGREPAGKTAARTGHHLGFSWMAEVAIFRRRLSGAEIDSLKKKAD